jgi:hypothetical protein
VIVIGLFIVGWLAFSSLVFGAAVLAMARRSDDD